jgi:fatty acid desaturase
MDDFIGVRGVMESRRLKELSARSDLRGAVQMFSHLAVIGGTGYGIFLTWGTWWVVPIFVLHGALIGHFYAPLHECDHGTAFKSRWLNQWFARVLGFFIFLPSDAHKWLHFAHHRHTQDFARDTEIVPRGPFTNVWQCLWIFSGVPYYFDRGRSIVRYAFNRFPETPFTDRQKAVLRRAARWHLAGYAAIAGGAAAVGSWAPLIYWIGPIVSAKWLYWFQGMSEHTGLTQYQNTLENTRTFKTNPFMRWMHWNMTYHTVHHTFPSVPFFRLPLLHKEVQARYPHPLPVVTYIGAAISLIRGLFRHTELELVAIQDAAYERRHGLNAPAR